MTIREIKKSVSTLNTRQLVRLDAWLHELIEAAESKKQATPRRRLVEEHKAVNKTYRLEEVRCGKKNCHCTEGKLHGPYWYAYWTEGGRTRSQYVGKKLPKGVRLSASQSV